MTTLTQRLPDSSNLIAHLTLQLTAEERTRSRHCFQTTDGQTVYLQLPRGTLLRDGNLLQAEPDGVIVRVVAKPEPVMTVTGKTDLALLKAAYHLGNRHVPLEITSTYLRLSADPVLRDMLEHQGLCVVEEVQPFQPEAGAYGHG